MLRTWTAWGVIALMLGPATVLADPPEEKTQGVRQRRGRGPAHDGHEHPPGQAVGKGRDRGKAIGKGAPRMELRGEKQDEAGAAREHAEAAKEAFRKGHKEAMSAFKDARAAARKKAGEARDEAKAKLEAARAEARAARDKAEKALAAAGDEAKGELKTARDKAKGKLAALEELLRDFGAGAAAGLEEAERAASETAREIGKAVRKGGTRASAARKRVWARWKAEIRGRGRIDAGMQREFRKHAHRMARLARIKDLADEAGDDKAVARVERLESKEQARHERRMKRMTAKKAKLGQAGEKRAQQRAANARPNTEGAP
ncbi:MAG: hypothetical protein OXU20_22445 [Myxococcales bacterium]|nr:hypothetical protein [Myxococcales bacterium]